MSGTLLARRADDLRELMDDPDCDPERLRRTLERFDTVNRLVSGWGRVYRARIRPFARERGGAIRILDIGCGGGDVLRRLTLLARRDGLVVSGVGIDPDPRALDVARTRRMPGLEVRSAHSSELVAAGERFDVVVSNHVLHHLGDAELAAVLADSDALSDGLVLHSDIARSPVAYAAYAVGITPLAPGTFLRTDGLRSIRRSWRPAELAATLPSPWRVERAAPFRVLVTRQPRP
jgi:2-polyprenyl-3-methyl-5-hydroxy-6-metoxy-1,4-benzoquinol methylase